MLNEFYLWWFVAKVMWQFVCPSFMPECPRFLS